MASPPPPSCPASHSLAPLSRALPTNPAPTHPPSSSHRAELSRHCGGLHPGKVTILFPAAFAALRQRVCPGGDAAFVESLRWARPWDAGHGGRSGSTFLKTADGRYLLKGVSGALVVGEGRVRGRGGRKGSSEGSAGDWVGQSAVAPAMGGT